MRTAALALLSVTACGRVGFAPLTSEGDAPDDAPDDALGDTLGDGASTACAFDVCEGFEGASFPGWTVDSSDLVDPTRPHRGNRSMRMTMSSLASGQSGTARIHNTTQLSPVPPQMWVRAYFYMEALPAGSNRLELISIEHEGGGGAGDYVFARATSFELFIEPSGSTSGTNAAPIDQWFCVVLRAVFSSGTSGSLDVTSDTLSALSIPNVQTNDAVTPVDTLGVGPYFAAPNVMTAQPAINVWVDDVIVHHAPVTCAD